MTAPNRRADSGQMRRVLDCSGTTAVRKIMGVVAAGVLSLAILLGTVFEVSAQANQSWQFTLNERFSTPIGIIVVPVSPFNVTVLPNGSFVPVTLQIPSSIQCPGGGSSTLTSGSMAGTQVQFAFTFAACQVTGSGSGSGQLNAAFPNATTTTSGDLSGSGAGVTVSGTFSASCQSGCGGTPPPINPVVAQASQAVAQAASLGNVALVTAGVQTSNIGLRMAALRQGATGLNVSGLSLNIDGKPVSLGSFNGLLSGGASGDRSSLMSRLGIFATAQGSFGTQDTTPREAGYDYHTVGVTVGADYRITDRLIMGLAFGYLHTKSAFDASAGSAGANGYNISGYGTYYIIDRLYVDAIVTGGWNTYNNARNIPDATATANSHTGGNQVSVSVSTGYNFSAGAFGFGPTARVNYIYVHIDGYQESGASPFNVTVAAQNIQSLTTDFGGQASYAISTPWGVISPLLRFEWEHEYLGNSRLVTGSLLGSPGTIVTTQTSSPDRDYFRLGAGVSATFKKGISAFLQFDVILGQSHFTNYAFNTGVRFEF